jgi:hypothetical protein
MTHQETLAPNPTHGRPDRDRGLRFVPIAAAATGVLLAVDFGIRTFHEYVEPVPRLRWVLNVGTEGNLATWWNCALLLSVAGMALLAASLSGPGARPGRLSWLALAAAAAWLSIDESVQVHERLAGPGKEMASAVGLDLPTYAWVLPGALLAIAGVTCAVLWARRLPRALRSGLMAALATYLTGALLVESFNGWARRQGFEIVYAAGTTLEEGMEMGACLVALAVLTKFVRVSRDAEAGHLSLRLRS